MTNNHFLTVIQNLRQQEEIVLYGNILTIKEPEAKEVLEFLRKEYEQEALDYPYTAPAFDGDAALWAATSVYVAAQLILYRENKEAELALLLPDFQNTITPSAILSADLCLRFLPDMLHQLSLMDNEDALIQVLERKLLTWHYSGISYPLQVESLDFTAISADKCLHQQYINRIIENKKIQIALHPASKELVQASLGLFTADFWNEFKIARSLNE